MRSFVTKAEAIVGQQGRFRISLQRPLLPDEMLKIERVARTKKQGRSVSERGWQREFDDPIALPNGGSLVTLEGAARYIQKLPKKEQDLPHWPRP
jgi:hypothetical protein